MHEPEVIWATLIGTPIIFIGAFADSPLLTLLGVLLMVFSPLGPATLKYLRGRRLAKQRALAAGERVVRGRRCEVDTSVPGSTTYRVRLVKDLALGALEVADDQELPTEPESASIVLALMSIAKR